MRQVHGLACKIRPDVLSFGMDRPDYNSPQALKKILDENGFAMQKKFGQNFLTAHGKRLSRSSTSSRATPSGRWGRALEP